MWSFTRREPRLYSPKTDHLVKNKCERLAQPAVFAAPCLVAARAHAHTRALNARAHVLRPRAKAASAETHALSTDRLSKTR